MVRKINLPRCFEAETVSHVSAIHDVISRIKSYTLPVENEIKACLPST